MMLKKGLILFLLLSLPTQAMAARSSASRSLPEMRVRVNPTITGGQREPEIAVCPNGYIYVAWIDTTSNRSHVSRSTDGGRTWTDKLPAGADGIDPALVCDAQNRLYFSWLTGVLGIIRSDDNFDSNTLVTSLGGDHSDKPFVAVGSGDTVYMTWAGDSFPVQSCSEAAYASNIYFQKSTTAGASFSSAVQLTVGTVANGRCTNAPMVVHPDGTIIIVLTCFVIDFASNPTCVVGNDVISGRKIYITRSTDGGATFSAPVEFPTVDFTANAYMNLTMAKARLGVPYYPVMMSNGNLGIVWSCDTGADIDVCFAVSTDKGATFGSTVKVNSDAAGSNAYHFWPAVSAGPNCKLYFIWQDTRSPGSALVTTTPATFQTYRRESNDCGATFTNERIVSPKTFAANDDNSSSTGISIFISCSLNVCATADTTLGTADVYFYGPAIRGAATSRAAVTRLAAP